MKLTNGAILDAGGPLRELIAQKFPVMISYKLAKMGKKLNDQLEVLEEVRLALIRKYGTRTPMGEQVLPVIEVKDEAGKVIEVEPNPQLQLFQDEWAELRKKEVSIELDGKVKLPAQVAATCDKCHHNMDKPLEIEARILMALDFCIEV